MKRFLSLLLTLILLLSFTGCEKKSDYVEFGLWIATSGVPSHTLSFLEADDVTEYHVSSDKSDFYDYKICVVEPGDELMWNYIDVNMGDRLTDYIRIIARSEDGIVGYAVIRVVGSIEWASVLWTPSVIKSVRFSDKKIEEGIKQEYVDGLMNEIIEREERK